MPTKDNLSQLKKERQYISERLEKATKQLSRLDVTNLELTRQLKQTAEAFNFIKTIQEKVEKASTESILYEATLKTLVSDLYVDNASLARLDKTSEYLLIAGFSHRIKKNRRVKIDLKSFKDDLQTPTFASSETVNNNFEEFIIEKLGFPYFVWYPLSDKKSREKLFLYIGNNSEDYLQKLKFSEISLEMFGAIASALLLRRDNIKKEKELLNKKEEKIKLLIKTREKIEREKNKTKITLDSLTDGLILLDGHRKILILNPEAEKILNVQERRVIGRKMSGIRKLKDLDNLIVSYSRKRKERKNPELVIKDPVEKYYQLTITPARAGSRKIGTIIILRNITREKLIDRMKSDFISIAAHQLRTPLSAIKWAISLVLNGDSGEINEEQRHLLEKGQKSNDRVIGIINDMLNVSRIEEGRFGYEFKEANISTVIDEALSECHSQVSKKNIKLKYEKPAIVPNIKMDSEKILLVVQNLLDNAIKYTPNNGKIEIKLKIFKDSIKLRFKDNGVGIPEKDWEKIYSKFFRADNVIRIQTEGSGLGLFIAKNIIERHLGSIEFKSQEGLGTEFTITLPMNDNRLG